MPRPLSDRGHGGVRKTVRKCCQIVAAAQMMARLEREIVDRAEHAAIGRASEADWLYGTEFTANLLRGNVQPLEQTTQCRVEVRHETRAQFARGEQHREQATLTGHDCEFGMAKTHEMNIPVPEGATRRWGFRELLRQSQPFPRTLRTAEGQHRTSRLDDPRHAHHMRPKCLFAGTMISQSVKPFHQLIEQIALLSHAMCIIRKLRIATR